MEFFIRIISVWLIILNLAISGIVSFEGDSSVLSLLLKSARILNGTTCVGLLHDIDVAAQEEAIWAYKLLDASGTHPTNFLWGNNFFLGSPAACSYINNYKNEASIVLSPRYPHHHAPEILTEKPPFPVNYRVIYAETFSEYQIDMQTYQKNILHFGVCVPAACTDPELAQILEFSLTDDVEFNLTTLALQETHLSEFLNATVLYSKTLNLRKHFFESWPAIFFMVVLFFHILAAMVCTFLDKKVTYMPPGLQAFSWKNKWSNFLNGQAEGCEHSLTVVHGIKALSMLWIITGHISFFSMASMNNLPMILPYMTQILRQPVFTSPTSVDTFFAISAFLMSYHLFKRKRENPKFNFNVVKGAKMILYRFLRFTPAYAVSILLILVVSMVLNDVSPYWMLEDNEKNCKQYWWRNLLFFNNFYPIKEMCMSWSWYLAVELQCFTVGTVLMVIYYWSKPLGLILAFLTFKFSLFLTSMRAIKANYALSLDVQYHTLDLLYTPIWTRLAAYIIGMLSGHYLSIQKTELQAPKWFIKLLTLASQFGLMFVVHSQAIRQENHFIGPFIVGFGRIIWAWAICWTIIACSTGNLKAINKFYTNNFLIVLSKLTYSVYLINPIVILAFAMSMETPISLAPTNTFLTGLGFVIAIYGAAVVFKFLFEDPYSILLRHAYKDCFKSAEVKEVMKLNNETESNNNEQIKETSVDDVEKQTTSISVVENKE